MPRRPRVWEGMSSDALHPAVPALTCVPPLSPPGLVAAWPDSPGLLPPPCLLPTPGQWATLPEGHCACPGKGLWGGERAAGCERGYARQHECVCQHVSQCVRGRGGLGLDPRESGGASQLARSMVWFCDHGVGGFSPPVVCVFYVCPQLCSILRHSTVSYKDSGLWHRL